VSTGADQPTEHGQVSPDGNSYWNGAEWRPTISDDKAWRWDGSSWLPLAAGPAPKAAWTTLLRVVPGFRSANLGKAVLATGFYLSCSLGILTGVVSGAFEVWGFCLACLLIGPLSVFLWASRGNGRRIWALGAALGLTIAFGGWALATAPPGSVGTRNGSHASTTSKALAEVPLNPTPAERPVASPSSVFASPTPTLLPSPSPTPTGVPSSTPTPASIPPTAKPIAIPTQVPPPPTQPPVNLCGAPSNPWNYGFCGGSKIFSPPANFCTYFPCIASFWKSTLGYVDQCVDGTYSHSGGRSGACSSHGGESRPLYSP
jgi:hypothetical protein